MYIRVTPFAFDLAREEKTLRIVDEQLIPAFQQMPGFVSYSGGLDRATQRGVAVTIWDNMEHAAGLRTALGGMIQEIEAAGVSFEPAQVYELTRQA
jgi:hypothetical protein